MGLNYWLRFSLLSLETKENVSVCLINMAPNDFSFITEPSPRTPTLNSTTFTPPSQDRLLLVSEILQHHYLNSPNHPIFKYEDSPGVVKTIYWSDWYLAIHRAGRYVREIFRFFDPNERPVIAMLANTGACSTWQLWICSLWRLSQILLRIWQPRWA